MSKAIGSFLTLTALCLLVGCGGKPTTPANRAAASGVVTFNGVPLPAGSVGIQTSDGKVGTSVSIRDGKFSTNRASLGEVTVTVNTKSVLAGNPSAYVEIPERYEDPLTSGLKATIPEDGTTELNFALEK